MGGAREITLADIVIVSKEANEGRLAFWREVSSFPNFAAVIC